MEKLLREGQGQGGGEREEEARLLALVVELGLLGRARGSFLDTQHALERGGGHGGGGGGVSSRDTSRTGNLVAAEREAITTLRAMTLR